MKWRFFKEVWNTYIRYWSNGRYYLLDIWKVDLRVFLHEWNKWKKNCKLKLFKSKSVELCNFFQTDEWENKRSISNFSTLCKKKFFLPSLEITVYVPRWSKSKCVFIAMTSNIPRNCSLRFPMNSKFIRYLLFIHGIQFFSGGIFRHFLGVF